MEESKHILLADTIREMTRTAVYQSEPWQQLLSHIEDAARKGERKTAVYVPNREYADEILEYLKLEGFEVFYNKYAEEYTISW